MVKKYSQKVLDETPPRVLKFLTGIDTNHQIRIIMADAGMEDYDLNKGGDLLRDCLFSTKDVKKYNETYSVEANREASSELIKINKTFFARCRAPIKSYYPNTYEYLFYEIQGVQSSEVIFNVATLLARLDLLESGGDPSRVGHFEDDKAAVELLAKRGIDANERRRLQGLIDVAFEVTDAIVEVAPSDPAIRRARLITGT